MKRFAAVLLTLAVLLCPSVRAAGPGISAASAILIDGESGRVLYAQNAEEERPIASITKLMTALVAVESHPDLSEVVTIRPEWTGVEGSSMYLKAGEELTLEALLYGLLLASGNDAAVAIAGFCAGDVDTFVAWMNDKAAELGMEHTHFENPNGLNDEGHYSTAADMAALARVVMEHEALAKIVGTRSITVAGRTLTNHNKLLWRYEGCTGLKTGYTDRAGRTLVSCAERDGQRLIAVTLNDPNDWADHAALFDYCPLPQCHAGPGEPDLPHAPGDGQPQPLCAGLYGRRCVLSADGRRAGQGPCGAAGAGGGPYPGRNHCRPAALYAGRRGNRRDLSALCRRCGGRPGRPRPVRPGAGLVPGGGGRHAGDGLLPLDL